MSYRLVEKQEAVLDTIEIVRYYDQINVSLSDRFLEELDLFYDRIIAHPTSYPVTYKEIRHATLKVLPYQVLYGIDDKKANNCVCCILYKKEQTY